MYNKISFMRVVYIFFLIFLGLPFQILGQSHIFSTDNGLSSNLINAIHQDKDGMIWIATEDGLNRYDGAKIKVYKHEPTDKHSLCHNYVCTLAEDNQGRLLVGTYNGLQIYNPGTDTFSKAATWEGKYTFTSNIVSITPQKNGEIWVSGNSLCKLDLSNDKIIVRELELPIPTQKTRFMHEDTYGNSWFVTLNKQLIRINKENNIYHYNNLSTNITNVCEDHHGNIYIGTTNKGLFKYNRKSDSFLQIPYAGDKNLSIKKLFIDDSNRLFAGTDGKGLKVLDEKGLNLIDYSLNLNEIDSRHIKVHSILKDKNGNFWLGIFQKGVIMIPTLSNKFNYIGHKSKEADLIGDFTISALHKDHSGYLWVGTDNDGLYRISPDNKKSVHYPKTDNPYSVPDVIMSIFEDSEQNIWIGSYLNGMAKLDRQTGRCHYLTDLKSPVGIPIERVYSFVEDNEKRLWIATMGNGLHCYDIKQNRFIKHSGKIVNNNWLTCLHYSAGNKLYVGSYDGLNCIDLNSEEYTSQHFLDRHIIYSIYEDIRGDIWIGTSDGLFHWNIQTLDFTLYNTASGLPSNSIYSIQEDDGNLWISTNNGLTQFDPQSHKMTNYYLPDGLQGNEFSKNVSFKDNNGTLYFGGVNGITYFNPFKFSSPSRKWTVRISDFYLHNTPVRKGMTSGGKPIISSSVFHANHFDLSHSDNSFTIEFATKELNAVERCIYHYSFDNKVWSALPKGINRASFSDLTPGTHRLKVKALDNTIESDIKEITITIRPPWWGSIWAKAIYALLFIGAICLTIIRIKHHYRIRQEALKREHAEQLNESKLQFLINISHEIRTPISLITSPLSTLIKNETNEEKSEIYRTINRNAERVLRLMNQLLDVHKIDKGQMHLKFQQADIIPMIEDICNAFSQQAKHQDITLTFSHDGIHELPLWINPESFDKMVLNILSNAFKFTPKGGRISILLHIEEANNSQGCQYAVIQFVDTGTGINSKELDHIFNRFYQSKTSPTTAYGVGIGLHLTRLLTELHHGTITAHNNPKNAPGCNFIVRLPLGCEHLAPEEINDAPYSASQSTHDKTVDAIVPIIEGKKYISKTKFRILIADDNEEILHYLYQNLSFKYHIIKCKDGREALEQIFAKKPDLIISDIMMPEIDGITLCKKVKQNINLNTIPIILLTSKTEEEDKLSGLEAGADTYISKPFNIEILTRTIENLINSRESLKNVFNGQQSQDSKIQKIEAQSPNDKLLERITKVVNENISNPELNVEMISEKIGISRVHLHRKLKELTNQSTRDFIRNIRLKQAALLLSQERYTIAEVAWLTGFTNPNNFSTLFKDLYGIPPTTYMNQHLKDKQNGITSGSE